MSRGWLAGRCSEQLQTYSGTRNPSGRNQGEREGKCLKSLDWRPLSFFLSYLYRTSINKESIHYHQPKITPKLCSGNKPQPKSERKKRAESCVCVVDPPATFHPPLPAALGDSSLSQGFAALHSVPSTSTTTRSSRIPSDSLLKHGTAESCCTCLSECLQRCE